MTYEKTRLSGFDTMLEKRGVSRRRFLEFCGALAVTLGLSEAMVPSIKQAIADTAIGKASGALTPVIWLELASCTGCTESFAQVDTPDVATVVLELISLNYSETLSAGAGFSLEEAKEETIQNGGYITVIEGALMEGWDGNALRIANEKGTEIVLHAASNTAAIICAGSCAVDGGWQAAVPNPGGATGIEPFLKAELAAGNFTYTGGEGDLPPIINVPSCPANPEHLVAVIVDVLLLGRVPQLNEYNMPSLIFGEYIHDNCPRRGHFENGEFVYQFGSEQEKLGYCLYPMGCKGPQTKSNCPIVRWNRRVSWCVESGAPCAGCAQANPEKAGFNWVDLNTPFLKRFKNLRIGDIVFQPATLAAAVGGIVVIALVAHGFGMKATGRTKGGAPFELERAWDRKHPDQATGAAEAAAEAARVQGLPLPDDEQAGGADNLSTEDDVPTSADEGPASVDDVSTSTDDAPTNENSAENDAPTTETTAENEAPAEGGEE
ncbi:MAG: hydrogenase small subunit [Coriobacteriales bacterium]|jgi:hydrogenase small subunit|nr:hydrogenase small subunit [Coriobacteriales bacterium]